MTQRVAFLFCGSFNPVTRTHLQLLKWGKEQLESTYTEFKVVKSIISPVNDLYSIKKKNLVPAIHRITMINLALREEGELDWVECDSWESDQIEWQRLLSVLNYHQNKIDSNYKEKVNLWFISGGDLIESMAVPGLWRDQDLETIFNSYKALVFPRPGSDPVNFILCHHILRKYKHNIYFADEWSLNEDSSTRARDAISKGYDPENILHFSVIEYIKSNSLYSL